MRYGFLDDDIFEINMALQCKIKDMKRIIAEFKSGDRYLKLQKDYHRIVAGYIKEIEKLKKELADAHKQIVTVRQIWTEECDKIWREHVAEITKKDEIIRKLEERIWELQRQKDETETALTMNYEEKLYEKDRIIQELQNKLAHYAALLGRDSSNTNLPTGQTPPGKEKRIPNGRKKSDKPKGGQVGHEKHVLEKPSAEKINDEIDHKIEEDEVCPVCGSENLIFTGKYEEKVEIDIEVRVKNILHRYWLYECADCGEIIKTGKGPELWAECQYGPTVQAIALSLMNTSNTAINKVPVHLSGITNGEVTPCEGYIAKLMPRAAGRPDLFMEELYKEAINLPLVYRDDTVVMADRKRICLRFYGNEKIAFYVAHDKKDMAGVPEDNILEVLSKETGVMHDHNSINYNKKFSFENIECNSHLTRDIQKVIDEVDHKELKELKDLVSMAIKDRNDIILNGGDRFGDEYIEKFENKLTDILNRLESVASENTSKYSGPPERAPVRRIRKFRDNYFAWMKDFSLPTTNNLSERALRQVKTKMKVSGQFSSTESANNYAKVRSYIEACRRNGINEVVALSRLCAGNPYTVKEILST